jgi:hypothetical protein
MSRKRKAEPVTRADAGHPTPPAPHPAADHHAHHVLPPVGIRCPRCDTPAHAPISPKLRRQGQAHRVCSTRYRPNAAYRVRRCPGCGKRFRTVERLESASA